GPAAEPPTHGRHAAPSTTEDRPTDRAPRDDARRGAPAAEARAARSDRARAEARLGWYLAGPAFVVMLAVTLYPILQAVYDSLFNYKLTAPDDRSFVGLNNYVVILTDPVWWQALWVTLLITVITVAIELVLGFALALVMHRAIKRLRGLLRTAILVPYGIITGVSAFAWFYALEDRKSVAEGRKLNTVDSEM